MLIKRISLDRIEVERQWLEKRSAPSATSISFPTYVQRKKIDPILRVEGPTLEDQYVLISSYTAYEKLCQADYKQVWCTVHLPTSPLQRVLKRLYLELNLHKKTGYAAGDMVFELWEQGYTIRHISQLAKVMPQVIKAIFLKKLKQKQEEYRLTAEELIYFYGVMDGMYVPGFITWPYKPRHIADRPR